ncbi:MAG: hypothetical protein ACPG4X_18645 [Pikeienuella sp.]
MAKVKGDVVISVGADVGPLQKNMAKGKGALRDFGDEAGRSARRFAVAAAKIATGAALIAGGVVAAAKSAGSAAKEIQTLSSVANTGVVKFQKWAAAVETVGVSQEKLSDILKDVNDRVGDFVATGGGPMKDFFENIAPLVGVTAEQFQKLSGPDALQLFYTSLEKANLSQAEMTFYMEAMASDLTLLQPLLANNGREIQFLGDKAQRTGRILSEDMVRAGADLDRELGDLSNTIKDNLTRAVLENGEELKALAEVVSKVIIPQLVNFAGAIADIVKAASNGIQAVKDFIKKAKEAAGMGPGIPTITDRSGFVHDDWENLPERGISGFRFLDPNEVGGTKLTPISTTANTPPPGTVIATKPGKPEEPGGGGGGRGGGGRGVDHSEFEALRQRYASETELAQLHYEQMLEKLREFREQKLGTEKEFNDLEAQIKQEHEDKLAEIEATARRAKMQAIAGTFGDLSGLMQSQSKKLFNIGKAAATAEAVVSGYQAATDAWQKGMKIGGPPLAAAFTGASLARTGALIAGIRSQTIGGGGGGVAAPGGGVAAASATPQAVNITGVDPASFYSGGAVESMINAIIDAGADRGVRLVVT